MTEISEEELERYKRIERLAQEVKRGCLFGVYKQNEIHELCDALPDGPQPLVSGGDLTRALVDLKRRDIEYTNANSIWAYERGMIAMALRKAADKLYADLQCVGGPLKDALKQLHQWADEEESHDK